MFMILLKGKFGWFWRVNDDENKLFCHSPSYVSKLHARRAAKKIAKANGYEYREVNE